MSRYVLFISDSCVKSYVKNMDDFEKEFEQRFIQNNPFLGMKRNEDLEFSTPDKDDIEDD